MYPPKPTKDPYTAVRCMWESLRRAANEHWGEQATVDQDDDGFLVTIKLNQKIPPRVWQAASKYMRSYLRKERWTTTGLSQRSSHVRMRIKYSPPKQKKRSPTADRAEQKTPQQNPTRLGV